MRFAALLIKWPMIQGVLPVYISIRLRLDLRIE